MNLAQFGQLPPDGLCDRRLWRFGSADELSTAFRQERLSPRCGQQVHGRQLTSQRVFRLGRFLALPQQDDVVHEYAHVLRGSLAEDVEDRDVRAVHLLGETGERDDEAAEATDREGQAEAQALTERNLAVRADERQERGFCTWVHDVDHQPVVAAPIAQGRPGFEGGPLLHPLLVRGRTEAQGILPRTGVHVGSRQPIAGRAQLPRLRFRLGLEVEERSGGAESNGETYQDCYELLHDCISRLGSRQHASHPGSMQRRGSRDRSGYPPDTESMHERQGTHDGCPLSLRYSCRRSRHGLGWPVQAGRQVGQGAAVREAERGRPAPTNADAGRQ